MGATYFIQICPTCGRRLEVKIEYIGLEVNCYHCRARFHAENSCENHFRDPMVSLHNVNVANAMSYCANYSGD